MILPASYRRVENPVPDVRWIFQLAAGAEEIDPYGRCREGRVLRGGGEQVSDGGRFGS